MGDFQQGDGTFDIPEWLEFGHSWVWGYPWQSAVPGRHAISRRKPQCKIAKPNQRVAGLGVDDEMMPCVGRFNLQQPPKRMKHHLPLFYKGT